MFAALGASAVLMGPAARGQAPPDLNVNLFRDLNAPAPNGQIYATFAYTGGTTSITADAVAYRGSVAAGNAIEILRRSLTFAPGGYATLDFGTTIVLNEGDIFSVCINPGRSVAESNFNNNCAEHVVSQAYTDLSINVADISIAPVGPAVGQPMTVTAKVRSKYNTAARTLVRLFQSHPQSPGAKLLGQNTINVPGNGTGIASFTLTRPPGDANLWVQLEDVYPREVAPTDNLASRNVYLKAIVNTSRTAPNSASNLPYASSPAVGDLLGTGQPVMVFAEDLYAGTVNEEARITALQVFNDGTQKELWSKSGFLVPRASAVAPTIADIDGDGRPEVIFEATSYDSAGASGKIGVFVLNSDGSTKWQHVWNIVGRAPCHNFLTDSRPAIGDWNGDGVADIVVFESELVVLDGRN